MKARVLKYLLFSKQIHVFSGIDHRKFEICHLLLNLMFFPPWTVLVTLFHTITLLQCILVTFKLHKRAKAQKKYHKSSPNGGGCEFRLTGTLFAIEWKNSINLNSPLFQIFYIITAQKLTKM